MTMNTRQAGAFTELIKKEERARELWLATHGQAFAQQTQPAATHSQLPVFSETFGSTEARPLSAGTARDLYNNAVSVSTPRLSDPNDPLFASQPQSLTRKVVRQVEVPSMRKVAVPTKETVIMDVMVPKQVKSVQLQEVEALTEREEQYEEFQAVPAVRRKKVYLERYVHEPYLKQVPVVKTRRVQVPVKKLREVETVSIVSVPEQRAVIVDGYREEYVPGETKRVEVEEYQTYEMRPVPTGQSQPIQAKDIGYGSSLPSPNSSQQFYSQRSPTSNSFRPQTASPSSSQKFGTTFPPLSPSASASRLLPTQNRLGFKVRSSATAPNICEVYEVEPNCAASKAGLRVRDIVLSVNGQQTPSLQTFRNVVKSSRGPLLVQIKRGADRFILTMQRE